MTYPDIDPVAISIGSLSIYWYGLTYLIGLAGAWALGSWRAKQPNSGWSADDVSDLIFYGAIGIIAGGRLGYGLFYGLDQWLQDPLWIVKVQQGGMSFHGGMLGVLAAFWYFKRKTGKTYFQVADFIVPMVPIGLGSGRIGNFINAELWGKVTDSPFGMAFPIRNGSEIVGWTEVRHPSMLYEFVLEGVLLFAVLYWYSRKPRPAGVITGLFGIGYGLSRILVEFVREPDSHLGNEGYLLGTDWITMGMVLSLPMVFVGLAMVVLGARGRWAYAVQGNVAKKQSK